MKRSERLAFWLRRKRLDLAARLVGDMSFAANIRVTGILSVGGSAYGGSFPCYTKNITIRPFDEVRDATEDTFIPADKVKGALL